MAFHIHPVLTVAFKEFKDCIRNRWLASGSVLFVILSLAIVYGSAATGGELNFRPLSQVMNSLVSLTVFLLPLLVILISCDAFAGEKEKGTLLLMLTYPVTRLEWLAGKAVGQGLALFLILIFGYSVVMILSLFGLLPYAPSELGKELFYLIGSGWILGIIFMLISFAVSICVDSKAQALAFLLLIWLLAVLLYDLGLLIFVIASEDALKSEILSLLVIANPASAFRLFNQIHLGVETSAFPSYVVFSVLIGWIVILFGLCYGLFRRKSV
ncbi:MAG: ABC transporter permease [Burkholderiales bacterium]|nr:ABC transporter permease [Burkholderiales bacterium]